MVKDAVMAQDWEYVHVAEASLSRRIRSFSLKGRVT